MPCPGSVNCSHITHNDCCFTLFDPYVGPSVLVYDDEHTSFNLVCASARLFSACLVTVNVYASYVIASGTQELHASLFMQMAMLLLRRSRCLRIQRYTLGIFVYRR